MKNNVDRTIDAYPEESRFVDLAKAGDAYAYVKLYDAYVERVYRYVYFRVINDAVAEGITTKVFCKAWEQLESYQNDSSSFVTWIYEIARNQVMDHYKTNLKIQAIDVSYLLVAAYRGLNDDIQDLFSLEEVRNHLRFLTADQQQILISKFINKKANHKNASRIMLFLKGDIHSLQVSTLQTLARYLEDLDLRREVKPSSTFNAYTRSWLPEHLQLREHRSRSPQSSSLFWRTSIIYSGLIAALLVTGTAKAQSALPGELFYGWKRTSEQAWRSMSPDPVGTDIILADRRLNEWIAVGNDPARRVNASNDYFDALARLQSTRDAGSRVLIISVLKSHRQELNDAGLSTTHLDNYLIVGGNPNPGLTPAQVPLTEVVPPSTEVPIEIVPPATEAPTEIVPPATEVPTEVAPPATEAPTEVAPPATEVPTEVAPPTPEAPTEIVNSVLPTDISQTAPTNANP